MEGDTPEQHSAHDALSSRGVWPHAMQTVPSVKFEYGVIMWTRFVKTECGLGLKKKVWTRFVKTEAGLVYSTLFSPMRKDAFGCKSIRAPRSSATVQFSFRT